MSKAQQPAAAAVAEASRPRRTRVFQWVPTDDAQLADAEARLFSRIAGTYTQRFVAGLNTITSRHPHGNAVPTLVLVHGFAGGVGNWMPIWPALRSAYNVYALDLPGFARSHRPKVTFGAGRDALDFMISGIAAWFDALQDEIGGPVVLVGHSFGGYISAHFAIRYPSRIGLLVLADPWGAEESVKRDLPLRWRFVINLLSCMSPLAVLRAAGPYGPELMPKVRKDFADRWKPYVDDPYVFYDYTFHCNAGHPTGELAFKGCATKDVFARHPLAFHLPKELDTRVPLALVYGAQTWMSKRAGGLTMERFTEAGGVATFEEVSNAGHQVMSDNAEGFAAAVARAVDTFRSRLTLTSPCDNDDLMAAADRECGEERADYVAAPY